MPTYEFRCFGDCKKIEITKGMNDPSPETCPHCGGSLQRIYSCYFHGPCDAGDESQNNGAGKWYPELGARYLDAHTKTTINPKSHFRSRADAIESVNRRGGKAEKC
jgi:putative FmdB family regulatory protein